MLFVGGSLLTFSYYSIWGCCLRGTECCLQRVASHRMLCVLV